MDAGLNQNMGTGKNAMAEDADVIVVGGGLAGLVAATEIADAGKRVIVRRPGRRTKPRRPGLLVVRRLIPGGQLPNSAGSASRIPTIWRCRTGWAPRASTARKTFGRSAGRKPMSASRPAKSATGCARWAIAFFPWSAGPSAAAMTRWATAIRCRAFTSPGAPAPASSSRSSGARARRRRAAG